MKALLQLFHRLVFRHWRISLAAAAAISLLSLWSLPRLRLETGRSEMSRGNAAEEHYQKIAAEFGLTNTLVLVAEAPHPDSAANTLLALCQRLEAKGPAFGELFCRLDHPYLLKNGLYLMPPADFQALSAELGNLAPVLAAYRRAAGLPGALQALDHLLQGNTAAEIKTADLQKLGQFFKVLQQAVRGRPQPLADFFEQLTDPAPTQRVRMAQDGSFAFGLFFPASARTDTAYILPLIQTIKEEAAALTAADRSRRITLAGEPAIIADEMTSIDRDNSRLSVLSFLGVALLFFLAYHRRLKRGLWILTCLALGILWSFGWVNALYGRLNLVSSVFVMVLIGLGIDYGIFWLGKFEEEEAKGSEAAAAAHTTYFTTGRGIVTGAFTTIAAFAAVGLSPYRGFAELGWICAGSMACCLVIMLVLFPGGVVHWTGRSGPAADALGRLGRFTRGLARLGLRWPKATCLAALLLLLPSLYLARQLRFEHNILALLPRGAPSTHALQLLEQRSDFRIDQALFSLPDFNSLQAVERQLRSQPLVAGSESVLDLLPRQGEDRRRALQALAAKLSGPTALPAAAAFQSLGGDCRRLADRTAGIAEAIFSAGRSDLLAAAGELQQAAAELCRTLAEQPPAALQARSENLAAFFAGQFRRLQKTLGQPPPRLEQLPPELTRRLVSPQGRYLLAASPKGSLWDKPFLLRYVAAMQAIDPAASGFPVQFLSLTGDIFRGFVWACALSALAIFLLVLWDFASLSWTFLCLTPLFVGLGWTLGGMALLQLPFSLVNIIALPLVAGMGMDSSLQMAHALHDARRQKEISIGVAGRNSLLAAATAICCFGLLAFSSHRGMAALGLLLCLGLAMIFAAAVVLTPALAKALGMWHPEAQTDGKNDETAK